MVHKIPRKLRKKVWYIVYYENRTPKILNKAFFDVDEATKVEEKLLKKRKVKGTFVDWTAIDVRELLE